MKISTEVKSRFGNELKRQMNKNNINNKELGELLGRPHWRVSDFVSGRTLPTKEELNKICDLLNVAEKVFFSEGTPRLWSDREYLSRSNTRVKSVNNYSAKSIGKSSPEEEGIELDVENELSVGTVGAKEEDNIPVNAGQNVLIPELAVPSITDIEQVPKNLEKLEKFKEIVEQNDKKQVISKKIEIKIPSINENQCISITVEEIISQ